MVVAAAISAARDRFTFPALVSSDGTPFKHHRTGDVTRIEAADSPFGVAAIRKRFWYPTGRDRWRGVLRTTWLARSRVAGEFASLEALAAAGLQPRLALAFGEARHHGMLRDSFLFLRWIDASPLAERLRMESDRARRTALLVALGRFAGSLHRLGFVDRDLHLRNLLVPIDAAKEGATGPSLVKIDSPFGRLAAGAARQRGEERDRADLERDLAATTDAAEQATFRASYSAARAGGSR